MRHICMYCTTGEQWEPATRLDAKWVMAYGLWLRPYAITAIYVNQSICCLATSSSLSLSSRTPQANIKCKTFSVRFLFAYLRDSGLWYLFSSQLQIISQFFTVQNQKKIFNLIFIDIKEDSCPQ